MLKFSTGSRTGKQGNSPAELLPLTEFHIDHPCLTDLACLPMDWPFGRLAFAIDALPWSRGLKGVLAHQEALLAAFKDLPESGFGLDPIPHLLDMLRSIANFLASICGEAFRVSHNLQWPDELRLLASPDVWLRQIYHAVEPYINANTSTRSHKHINTQTHERINARRHKAFDWQSCTALPGMRTLRSLQLKKSPGP